MPAALAAAAIAELVRDGRPVSRLLCAGECRQLVFVPTFDRDGRELVVALSSSLNDALLSLRRLGDVDIALLAPPVALGRLAGRELLAVTDAPTLLPKLQRLAAQIPAGAPAGELLHAGDSDIDLLLLRVPLAGGTGAADAPEVVFIADHTVAVRQIAADVVDDGEEALRRLQSGVYAALITDIQMPGLDGYQLAERQRAREARGEARGRLPILALSARALEGETQRCLTAGMDDYLSKPVLLQDLDTRLRRWIPDAPDPVAVAAGSGGVAAPPARPRPWPTACSVRPAPPARCRWPRRCQSSGRLRVRPAARMDRATVRSSCGARARLTRRPGARPASGAR